MSRGVSHISHVCIRGWLAYVHNEQYHLSDFRCSSSVAPARRGVGEERGDWPTGLKSIIAGKAVK